MSQKGRFQGGSIKRSLLYILNCTFWASFSPILQFFRISTYFLNHLSFFLFNLRFCLLHIFWKLKYPLIQIYKTFFVTQEQEHLSSYVLTYKTKMQITMCWLSPIVSVCRWGLTHLTRHTHTHELVTYSAPSTVFLKEIHSLSHRSEWVVIGVKIGSLGKVVERDRNVFRDCHAKIFSASLQNSFFLFLSLFSAAIKGNCFFSPSCHFFSSLFTSSISAGPFLLIVVLVVVVTKFKKWSF